MMYLVGMSHAINVLKSVSRDPLSFSHENWGELATGEQFFDIHTKSGLIQGDIVNAFIVSQACGWGAVAEFQTTADGRKVVTAVDGFVRLLRSLESKQDDNVLVSILHGNSHSMLSMLQHPVSYDFFLPRQDDCELAPGTQPIPYEIVRQQVERAMNHTIASILMIRAQLPRMRIVHVLPPPPIESEAQIMRTPEIFRDQLTQRGITPISIRVKYYLLSNDIQREALSPFNIELLDSPPEAVSANGAIKDEYAFGATHANEAYGALVFNQILTQLNINA